ncbi:MAG TPA: SdrD B-like domain-containing protein, partial [Saprospiraceae bacterium]|nr:SdrD B-like domain-containing protein [Saprospiraceae bacterium]
GSVFVDYSVNLLPDPGEGISGVMIKLLADNNANGVADNNTPIATQVTDVNGDYVFAMVAVGNYVLTETTPANYFSTKDYDPTNDSDAVPNTNMNNDTIPVSLSANEGDANNYFIDAPNCPLIVTNVDDDGYASFRFCVNCANAGDTIRFHSSLTDQIIWLTSQNIIFNKNLNIVSALSPRVTIASATLGLFTVQSNVTVLFKDLNLISGDVIGSEGAAFDNLGTLKLHNVTITQNSFYPAAVRLIRNQLNSSLFLSGTCNLQQ